MTPLQIPLIPEGCWIQGYAAIDRKGDFVNPTLPEACRWCLDGWMHKFRADRDDYRHEPGRALDEALMYFTSRPGIIAFNDRPGRTAEEVNELITKANELLEKESQ